MLILAVFIIGKQAAAPVTFVVPVKKVVVVVVNAVEEEAVQ